METITIKRSNCNEQRIEVDDLSQVSDGYHTTAELYDHRIRLFIALCREWCGSEYHCDDPWRSKIHSDGSTIEGWFILGIRKERGRQISYHLPLSYWEETEFADTLDRAPEWDGHTSADVLERLKTL